MGIYERHVLPRIISLGMKNPAMARHRQGIPPRARGRVLEIGLGSGLNIPLYPTGIEQLYGLEPSQRLREEAAETAARAPFPVQLIGAGAEHIPLDAHSIDTVISTWTLCSIPDVERALAEVRRVLRPGGRFVFLEHGRSPDAGVAKWQDRLAPALRVLAGCNPNRQMDALIRGSGFRFETLEQRYFDGPRFIAWHFTGTATPD